MLKPKEVSARVVPTRRSSSMGFRIVWPAISCTARHFGGHSSRRLPARRSRTLAPRTTSVTYAIDIECEYFRVLPNLNLKSELGILKFLTYRGCFPASASLFRSRFRKTEKSCMNMDLLEGTTSMRCSWMSF